MSSPCPNVLIVRTKPHFVFVKIVEVWNQSQQGKFWDLNRKPSLKLCFKEQEWSCSELCSISAIILNYMWEDNLTVKSWKDTPLIPLCDAWSFRVWRECCFKDHKLGTNTIFRWCKWAGRVDVLECTWLGCLRCVAGQQPWFLRDCPPKL